MKEIKILIADNVKKDQKFYTSFFYSLTDDTTHDYKYFLDFASTGEETFEKIVQNGYDFIIFEEFLPKKKATDILSIMKINNINIPSVMITKKGSEHLAVKAFRLGIKNYFRKENLNLEELKEEILKNINLPQSNGLMNFEYHDLIKGQEYEFAYIKFGLRKNSEFTSHYSKRNLDVIFNNIRMFFEKKVKKYGGEMWSSKATSFLAAFRCIRYSTAAVLCGIEIFSGLSLYNISERGVSSDLFYSLCVHKGPARYQDEKDIIISRDLNFTAHMEKNTHGYYFVISEELFKDLDKKLKIHFKENYEFENRKIYTYLI